MMIRQRRNTAGAAVAATGLVAVGIAAAGPALATTPDQAFIEAVTSMGISFGPGVDLPQVGHSVCDMLTTGLAANVNPVPTVRGVVQTLQNSGLERKQAVGLMHAAVTMYCPQHSRVVGR